MTNQEKLNEAVRLMREVSKSIGEERGATISKYSEFLPSFDELVEEISVIELTN